ncbi:hypothetical protein ARMGADRAFT_1091132 [Armillaria gallica]|uniref:Uncharacterized protein n=1 Tax=Armillaria gallica TaxID=47427 RepID=A0A2H3CQY5_ARMGA|nr:hypothetical protein ARMGADRAFT_1091132 [Armillaria gallica]
MQPSTTRGKVLFDLSYLSLIVELPAELIAFRDANFLLLLFLSSRILPYCLGYYFSAFLNVYCSSLEYSLSFIYSFWLIFLFPDWSSSDPWLELGQGTPLHYTSDAASFPLLHQY